MNLKATRLTKPGFGAKLICATQTEIVFVYFTPEKIGLTRRGEWDSFMKTRNKRILLFLIFIFACALDYSIYKAGKYLHENGISSCLYSVARQVEEAQKQNRFEIKGESRELTQDEVKQLFAGRRIADCGSDSFDSGEIHIAIENLYQIAKQIKVKVWTNGDDGIQGTSDDLVVPFEEKAP